jgi:methyl-accepting chemotaxis protein
VSDVSRTIASAVEEQSITTREIAVNVAQSAAAAETVARGVSESAGVSQDIARNIASVDTAIQETARGASDSQDASAQLLQVAEEMLAMLSQFKTDARKFDSAPIKAAHMKWRARLSEMITGRRSLQLHEVTDHTQCVFGKWNLGEGRQQFGRRPAFQAIDAEHQKVHALARSIVERFHAGRKAEAAEDLPKFKELSQKLFDLLDQLEREVNGQPAAAHA